MKKVVIVGGGSAGWMSAAFLAKVLGASVQITLLESKQIATVGVGEATIPPIQLFNQLLGISEPDFIAATQATFKLGIQFEHWGNVNERYMHAFGPTGKQMGLTPFVHYWLRARAEGDSSVLGDYSFNSLAAKKQRFGQSTKKAGPGNPSLVYAYHFDASAYAQLLKKYSLAQGVVHCEGTLADVQINALDGNIQTLKLTDGRTISGDLFIDCSGQRSLLLGQALKVPFESWQHWLPCNRAVAIQSDAQLAAPFTRAIAHSNGWQWQIPLQNRTGNGLVYASDFGSDAQAIRTLEQHLPGNPITDPNVLSFKVGRYRDQWRNNCVAIGLASGFLEPLESTSLHMVQSSLVRLAKLFPAQEILATDVAEFNRQATLEAEGIRDFIILHYRQTQRQDSDFWRNLHSTPAPESLQDRIDTFLASGYLARRNDELFDENAWTQVLIGQGLIPKRYHVLAEQMPKSDLIVFLRSLRQQVDTFSETLSCHQSYVKNLVDKKVRNYA
jgi:tryptophan halogenase